MKIRKTLVRVEETLTDAGRPVDGRRVQVTAALVVANPAVGRFVEDLSELEALGAEIAAELTRLAVAALPAGVHVDAYGKGAIIGTSGEIEHAAAILHPRFGAPVRAAIGGGADIIPSTKKVAAPGASLTMPITNKDDRWSFDDMSAAEITVGDAPLADEMLIALVLAAGGRPHARIGKPA